ncbi:FimB/Mfa2 family fimbrial subunit [Dysgonomonas termitidis]|uniref:FimB/Mfa2 family fimbrial subunit n=1 Tax=Dysgonomonas termitidis TaxID=1516126 RepID=A0ABV9KZL7_9BACT
MKTKCLYILLLVIYLFALTGCIDEREGNTAGQGDEQLVSFSIRVPGAAAPKTKALTGDDENEVANIVLLLFNSSGYYTYQPIYINNVTTTPGNSAIKTFTAKVPVGTYNMVVLANSSQIVSAALGSINQGDTKATVMQQLKLTNADKWNSDPADAGYKKIPMWGEIANLTVGESTPGQSVTLVRMVSKIDVTLSATAQTKFALKSVRLYNYNNQGYVAPDTDNNWSSVSNIVTAPTVPASAQKPSPAVDNPLLYDGISITTTDISCINEIYTFEAAKGSATGAAANTCLVIGGIYGSDGVETFYRVDFANTVEGATTYLDLLRNHHYTVTIADVKDSGLSTPENAFNSRPADITATITAWNDGGLDEFDAGGQYRLTVSSGEFNFSGSAGNSTLEVFTDYTDGATYACFEADGVTPATGGWLSVTGGPVTANTKTTLGIQVTANTGAVRTRKIKITAGNLTHVVTVTQAVAQYGFTLTKNPETTDGDFTDLTDLYDYGSPVSLPEPTDNGLYAWDGWYKNGSTRLEGGSKTPTVIVGAEGENNYTAKWYAPVTITIERTGTGSGNGLVNGIAGNSVLRRGATYTITTDGLCLGAEQTYTATADATYKIYCPKSVVVITTIDDTARNLNDCKTAGTMASGLVGTNSIDVYWPYGNTTFWSGGGTNRFYAYWWTWSGSTAGVWNPLGIPGGGWQAGSASNGNALRLCAKSIAVVAR